ncbi:MAG: glucosamine-6-phosphate deaminase [Armatimonadetes bacterium]|nr:glucosamine-6-phosphate deaminase [Armatimonadota bacterium]
MQTHVLPDPVTAGACAADLAADLIGAALARRGRARIIVATGASQFEMLASLTPRDLGWHGVTVFHLDEYVGLPMSHPASFRGYLRERFESALPEPLAAMHYIDGEGDVAAECARLAGLIEAEPIDVCLCGIGENGHLAFNDPPADFDTDTPYLVVDLDEACRRQQVGEGWFTSLDDVPTRAVSMSIRRIMASEAIVCTVPDERKARAVRNCLRGPVSNLAPASILQTHPLCHLVLDQAAASLLD